MIRVLPLLSMLSVLACSPDPIDDSSLPDDWMIGEYSGIDHEGVPTDDVDRLAITADGIARFYAEGSSDGTCNDGGGGGDEYRWEKDGDAVKIWYFGEYVTSHYRVTYVDCNTIAIQMITPQGNGESFELYRGEMCLQEIPCNEPDCAPCETVWCEGSPPPSCE